MDPYIGEDLPRLDDGTVIAYNYGDEFFKEYANYGFEKWKADGERFLTQSFIDEYVRTGIAPTLNDGRPELSKWLSYARESCIFLTPWGYADRIAAGNFFQSMLSVYSKNAVLSQYTPILKDLFNGANTFPDD
jgi:hypothetical protein